MLRFGGSTFYVPFEARFTSVVADVDADSHIAIAVPTAGDYLRTLVQAHSLCIVKWAKQLAALNLEIPKPYPTNEAIKTYIASKTQESLPPEESRVTDTEKGVKVWMERLKTALKDANPPPVDVQEAGKPPVRIEFTITDFSAAAAAAAAP